MSLKKSLIVLSSAAALSAGALAITTPASARVVCNRVGDCWSTHETIAYPRGLGVRVYDDHYADRAYREQRWRAYHRRWHDENHDHDRGYWRQGVWIKL